jgi:hypothetical protein
MSDLEDRIREALHDPRRELPTWPDPMPRIRNAARRRRARLALGALLAAALAAAAIVAPVLLLRSSTGGGPTAGIATSPPPATSSSSPPPPGWVRHSASGVSIDIPAAWNFHGVPGTALAAPTMLLEVGTGPLPTGGSCGPTAALRKLPPAGVLFVVTEYGNPAGEPYTFPPRGAHLALGPVGYPECWGVPTRVALFEDVGRYFQVQAVFGPKATAALRNQVRQSLDTLHIARIPGTELPAAFCRSGQWTYCPQAAWVYEVMNKAGVFHIGAQGTHAILAESGATPARSFALRTTAPQPGLLRGRCRSVAGTRVCLVGNRLVVAVHRLLLWLEPTSTAITHTEPGLPTRPALRRLIKAAKEIPVP